MQVLLIARIPEAMPNLSLVSVRGYLVGVRFFHGLTDGRRIGWIRLHDLFRHDTSLHVIAPSSRSALAITCCPGTHIVQGSRNM